MKQKNALEDRELQSQQFTKSPMKTNVRASMQSDKQIKQSKFIGDITKAVGSDTEGSEAMTKRQKHEKQIPHIRDEEGTPAVESSERTFSQHEELKVGIVVKPQTASEGDQNPSISIGSETFVAESRKGQNRESIVTDRENAK